MDNLTLDTLDASEASSLELPFKEMEVLEVVKRLNRDKARGPDGFTLAFFQDCWDVIKSDLMGVFQDFHTHSKFVKSINATFIALILNKPGAVDLKDFRPISLGDPLLSFLFVIVMEALSKLFSITVIRGFLSGFSVSSGSNGVINISHLLFADDTLVFCGANPDHLLYLRMLLLSFEAVSCLKINLDKSVLVPVGHVDNMDDLAGILGCGVSYFPLKYLGLPLGAPFKAKSSWDDVVGEDEEGELAGKSTQKNQIRGKEDEKLVWWYKGAAGLPFVYDFRVEKMRKLNFLLSMVEGTRKEEYGFVEDSTITYLMMQVPMMRDWFQ
ncbi:uncharacterized protein LOC133876290 [Alnus glutinosa]|uniref:uncharacterized protein LOC133876290 n=1 Tax=Alnus glutinosa TaxID=3517 RepID=UPI002D78D96B|nr:uncharacterized protein LOC133876290 [Alnus glutinosa]